MPQARYSSGVKGVPLAARIALLTLVIAAPILPFSFVWPGFVGVALYGVLVSTFAWIAGGPRVSIAVTVALAVLGVVAILSRHNVWLLALIVFLLGLGYGYAASRGVRRTVLQLPILVPYFMARPPQLFSKGEPTVNATYLLAVATIVILGGLWTVFVLSRVGGRRTLTVHEVPDARAAVVYGAILGLISATVVVVASTYLPNSHWVWMTLTLYVLANPNEPMNWHRMWERVGGTLAGFALVTLLALSGLPDSVLLILGVVSLWACLYFFLTKKPYWEYVLFLSMTVVLVNSVGISTVLLDLERMAFTLIGALLAILAAAVVDLLMYHRVGGEPKLENATDGDEPTPAF